jgi:hybrid cluster-associated redox disulfide protein
VEPFLNVRWTVDQLLRAYPQTITVFLTSKMDCVGCHLERFCSLEEIATAYKIPLGILLEKIHTSIHISAKEGE